MHCSFTQSIKHSARQGNIFKSKAIKDKQMNSQVVQHVSHVTAVIESVSVCLFSLVHLSLALEDISQVTPCCKVKKHNTILKIKKLKIAL